MKTRMAWLVALLQLALLGFMAGEREWVARTGEMIHLRTAPVDPNDPMRGDYVRLDYEISAVAEEKCRDGVATWFNDDTIYSRETRDTKVYAALHVDELGRGELVTLSDRRPAHGLYLRGRVDSYDRSSVRVRYGIEALFMQQGQALEFENAARGEKRGVPVNVRVAVSRRGLAVLRGYEWEALGLETQILRRSPPENATESELRAFPRNVIGANLVIKNHSDVPRAIVDLPGGRSFRLVRADRWGRSAFSPAPGGPPVPPPVAGNVVLLAPGATYTVAIDFSGPAWLVVKDQSDAGGVPVQPVALDSLVEERDAWFRLEYAPPPPEACAGLPHADVIYRTRLPSALFNPAGGVD